MQKPKENHHIARNMGIILMLAMGIALTPKTIKKIQSEKREKDFFKYIMQEIDKYAETETTEEEVQRFIKAYEEDPILAEAYLKELSESSLQYTKDLRKSAALIKKMDKTISFEKALQIINSEGYNLGPNITQMKEQKQRLFALKQGKAQSKK